MEKDTKPLPRSMTEIRWILAEESRKEILEAMPDLIGHEITLAIDHYAGGNIGKVYATITRWEPPTTG